MKACFNKQQQQEKVFQAISEHFPCKIQKVNQNYEIQEYINEIVEQIEQPQQNQQGISLLNMRNIADRQEKQIQKLLYSRNDLINNLDSQYFHQNEVSTENVQYQNLNNYNHHVFDLNDNTHISGDYFKDNVSCQMLNDQNQHASQNQIIHQQEVEQSIEHNGQGHQYGQQNQNQQYSNNNNAKIDDINQFLQ